MFRHFAFAAVVVASLFASPVQAQSGDVRVQSGDASEALQQLFSAEWQRGLLESPESASYTGDARYNDRWTDLSFAAIEKREAGDRAALETLHAIDRDALSATDQLNYDIFEWQLEHAIERQQYREYLQPVGHQGGVQTASGLAQVLPFASSDDYRDWLARMAAIPALVDQTIALMREGVAVGIVPSTVLMQRVPDQIAAQIVDDPAQSPFYRPFKAFGDGVPEADRAELQAQAKRIISEQIVPAYRELAKYFNDDYLPNARDSIAISERPDGQAYYEFLAGYYTTTDLSVDEIHRIGLAEVARIRAEMEQVKQEVGFDGSMAEFFEFLRTDPQFFHDSPETLLEAYRALAKRIDPELVKIAATLPRLPYGVRPIPDNIAPDTTTAYYMPGASDGSRPGYYYVNLYCPEVRPTWEMVPLTLHESVPGHHFQFALGLELPDAPMFRRTAYFVAYSEGWGLYAERLGYDMGLYDDPYDRMGQLAYDMWRAVRLVVDTGMHAKGWSREKAIEYFMDNAPKTRQDVVNEIDRYIGTPGQALAYKIGQLKISGLRARAEAELGEDFDLRTFNSAVLSTGSVPLAILERHMEAWIEAQKAESR